MKIKVLSREKAEIEVFNIKEPTLIISIRDFKDPDKARVSIKNENIKGIVFLNFDDVEENDRYYSCITDEDAKKICEAVNEMKDFVTPMSENVFLSYKISQDRTATKEKLSLK